MDRRTQRHKSEGAQGSPIEPELGPTDVGHLAVVAVAVAVVDDDQKKKKKKKNRN